MNKEMPHDGLTSVISYIQCWTKSCFGTGSIQLSKHIGSWERHLFGSGKYRKPGSRRKLCSLFCLSPQLFLVFSGSSDNRHEFTANIVYRKVFLLKNNYEFPKWFSLSLTFCFGGGKTTPLRTVVIRPVLLWNRWCC